VCKLIQASSATGTLRARAALMEGVKRVLEGANASQMGVQAFVMRGMASAVVRCEAQPCVRCKQRPFFGQ
jgi:hypothetical protein